MLFWEKIISRFSKENRNTSLYDNPELEKFITELLGCKPSNIGYYQRAFIHRSAQIKDKEGKDVNFERLEFLGDAVLGLIISEFIFEEAPDKQEGYLTKMISKIVSRRQLNSIGKRMKLKKRLHPDGNPSLGEDINGNLVEALVGAVYLDKGFKFATDFVFKNIIGQNFDLNRLEKSIASHKSLILEWGQKTKNKITFNTFEEENADDLTVFISVIRLNEKVVSKGRGTSKKRAEENASKRAYYSMLNRMEKAL